MKLIGRALRINGWSLPLPCQKSGLRYNWGILFASWLGEVEEYQPLAKTYILPTISRSGAHVFDRVLNKTTIRMAVLNIKKCSRLTLRNVSLPPTCYSNTNISCSIIASRFGGAFTGYAIKGCRLKIRFILSDFINFIGRNIVTCSIELSIPKDSDVVDRKKTISFQTISQSKLRIRPRLFLHLEIEV